jgi:hypothetical protein
MTRLFPRFSLFFPFSIVVLDPRQLRRDCLPRPLSTGAAATKGGSHGRASETKRAGRAGVGCGPRPGAASPCSRLLLDSASQLQRLLAFLHAHLPLCRSCSSDASGFWPFLHLIFVLELVFVRPGWPGRLCNLIFLRFESQNSTGPGQRQIRAAMGPSPRKQARLTIIFVARLVSRRKTWSSKPLCQDLVFKKGPSELIS